MTFDEQLQRSLGAASDHLRDELSRALLAVGAEVTAHANEAREAAVSDELARALDEAASKARVELAHLEARLADMTAASAAVEHDRAADLAAYARLVDAVRALDQASSLSDILDALVERASREAPRVGLLLVRNGELRGWRFAGFAAAVDPPKAAVVSREESGIVGEAIRTSAAVTSAAPRSFAPAFAALPDDRECFAIPLVLSGGVAAVLYADQGTADEANGRSAAWRWSDTLELLARHAARCLEAATAIKAVRVLTDPPEISDSSSSTTSGGGIAERSTVNAQVEM